MAYSQPPSQLNQLVVAAVMLDRASQVLQPMALQRQ
jgi:hypothetical protein